ncbi:MAG: (E)-4-hydroxy-3-methylbut-2-enyl-diphosphate synthase [Mycoplasmataceae bacterium]|jgi:(E)-4-hydroxy-3-methylbut-2-enyl-diphosphate synthase|nr:(E)-4-hydroxy-3-methylbut-2-enyl-diphosphate synthase [Mycoplasmataceae bacterium]
MAYTRSTTNRVRVGSLYIGHDDNVVVQAMTNTKTSDVVATLQQIKQLCSIENKICKIVRVSVLDQKDALALKQIVKKSPCPIIADIHFNHQLAIQAIDAGVAKIRINPCNFPFDKLVTIVKLAKQKGVAIRIGFNDGANNTKQPISQIIALIKKYVAVFEKYNFTQLIISVKSSDVNRSVALCKAVSQRFAYPQHIGLTEAGANVNAIVRSTIALSEILKNNIGDTIRISTNSSDICDQVKIASALLHECRLNKNYIKLICCPTCGRKQLNVQGFVEQFNKLRFNNIRKQITVAIMGCAVNGIGECQYADIGVYGINNKQVALYYRGKKIKTLLTNKAINEIKKLVHKFND